jgi:hypothetical protein
VLPAGTTTGTSRRDACDGERWIRCVAARKSDAFASKMEGVNVCGFRSIRGNHVLCTWTMIRWPLRNV